MKTAVKILSISGALLKRANIYLLAILILFFLLTPNTRSVAQHYQFSQFYSARTYLNPAFTGANACSRVSMTYRDQWASVPGSFVTYQLGIEHKIRNSGIGLLFFNDKTGYGGLTSTMFSGLYSYEVKFNRKLRFRFGMAAGAVTRRVDYGKFIFGDQVARGGNVPTIENLQPVNSYLDMSSGILAFTKNEWFGVSGIHLTQPNQTFNPGETSNLPFELRVHGGKRFYKMLDKLSWEKEHFTAAFNYKMTAKFDQLDIGAYYTRVPFHMGIWYRGIPLLKAYKPGYGNNDAVVFLVGVSNDRFNFGYSYDLTISKLGIRSGGSHEISVSYNICDNKRKRLKTVLISCPKF